MGRNKNIAYPAVCGTAKRLCPQNKLCLFTPLCGGVDFQCYSPDNLDRRFPDKGKRISC